MHICFVNSQGSGEGKDKTHQHTTAKYYPHDSHCRHGRDICLPARALIAMWISNYDVFIYKYFIVGQTVEIDPLGHVRVVEALQNFVEKCNPIILPGFHIHIAGVQQFHCRWSTFCIKDLYPFQFYISDHLGQDVL